MSRTRSAERDYAATIMLDLAQPVGSGGDGCGRGNAGLEGQHGSHVLPVGTSVGKRSFPSSPGEMERRFRAMRESEGRAVARAGDHGPRGRQAASGGRNHEARCRAFRSSRRVGWQRRAIRVPRPESRVKRERSAHTDGAVSGRPFVSLGARRGPFGRRGQQWLVTGRVKVRQAAPCATLSAPPS